MDVLRRSGFTPHPLLRNPHLQTLLPLVLRRTPPLPVRHERLELPDGDFIELAWAREDRTRPLLVLIPGLGGNADCGYVAALARKAIRRDYAVLIVQLRGAGSEPNRLARCYHHGDTADLRYLCRQLKRQTPRRRIAAVGWSLGGAVLLKALGEEGGASTIDVACAVSAPLRLTPCAEHLRTGLARIYQYSMLAFLKSQVLRKHAVVPLSAAQLKAVNDARDFFEFGDAYTAPVNGFLDVDDYCERAACGPYLESIARPTLVLQAADDPLLGPSALPDGERWSRWVRMEVAEHGGHVGFIGAGRWGAPIWWAERRVLRFIGARRLLRRAPRLRIAG